MPKTVSATEAKVHLGNMIEWATRQGDEVIIETRGKPTAVLLGYREYQEIQRLRDRARREEALARLEALAARMAQRNRDLSPDQADELADRVNREVVGALARPGGRRAEDP
ncbi:MAG: type II toxin-antitoxin system Phd/YefM family antitoxin [Deferrisomatales bacterium]